MARRPSVPGPSGRLPMSIAMLSVKDFVSPRGPVCLS
jgi:hypothetical protein